MTNAKLEMNELFQDRWRVVKKVAEGGFGAVYEAKDETTNESVAIKVESVDQVNACLKVEAHILLRLRGKTAYVCGIVGCGQTTSINYVVMALVGSSLSDLFKKAPAGHFSGATVARLAIQCLNGIQALHSIGFIHRDIKPANFAIGQSPDDKRIVYLLDFGLARYYRMPDGTGVRPPRESCGFRGTVRYASTSAHSGLDQGRHDDIWSLLYLLIEFHRGRLPWAGVEKENEIANMKKSVQVEKLLEGLENEYHAFHERLRNLRYELLPDYSWFRAQIRDIQTRNKYPTDGPFEWEESGEGGD